MLKITPTTIILNMEIIVIMKVLIISKEAE